MGEQSESVLEQFRDYESMYEIYKIPQDLEFVIDLVKRGEKVPRSKRALYEATLRPLVAL
jgi:hypothetical protein